MRVQILVATRGTLVSCTALSTVLPALRPRDAHVQLAVATLKSQQIASAALHCTGAEPDTHDKLPIPTKDTDCSLLLIRTGPWQVRDQLQAFNLSEYSVVFFYQSRPRCTQAIYVPRS